MTGSHSDPAGEVPSIAHKHAKRRVAPAGIHPGGYPRLMVDVLQHLPQRLDPPAVAAGHPGTVTHRIGHRARQHGCVVKVPSSVARVLHLRRAFEYQRPEDVGNTQHYGDLAGIQFTVHRLAQR